MARVAASLLEEVAIRVIGLRLLADTRGVEMARAVRVGARRWRRDLGWTCGENRWEQRQDAS